MDNGGNLTVSSDTETVFCLEGGLHPRSKGPFPIAWTEIKKNYVSFHLMSVYADPIIRKAVTPELAKRMQGKSCFNFKSVDRELFDQLRSLTRLALSDLKRSFPGWGG